MTDDTAIATMEALDDLLDRERGALLSGDLDRLVRMLDEKTTLIDTLNNGVEAIETQDERKTLHDLQSKVTRNQELLDSALSGIRSVAKRMSALHQVRKSLDTYDEAGHKTTIDAMRDRKMEKRA
ncbi:MAG: flagellar biosynthesis protein FlgN [Rhodobacterales bacterium]|nr:MAG: flagellar biosynthesis protein FlgN [Rhodobacterales bacterium]